MSTGAARAVGMAAALFGLLLLVLGLVPRPSSIDADSFALFDFDRPGIDAHNSPAAAADPSRPSVVAVADRIDTPDFSCSVSRSTDAGSTWVPVELPLAADAPNCYWPDVAFDGEGRLLVLYTATGGQFNLPLGVWLQRFRGIEPDGPAMPVTGPLAFHARMAVDGPRVLVSYVQAGPDTVSQGVGFSPAPNPVMVARSEDGGRSFAPPLAISEPERLAVLPSVELGPGGQVVVGALDLGDDVSDYEGRHGGQGGPPDDGRWRIVAYRSTDGGASFSDASIVADELVIPQRIIVNLGPAPGFAWDRRANRLYATWDAGREGGGGRGSGSGRDVFLASSENGGATWSTPAAVASRPRTQTLPNVSVAPDGRVDVTFYDRSDDPRDVMTEVALSSSWDGGRSFTTGTVSRVPFDSRIGFGSAQGIPLLGSHLAALSRPGGATAFWSDTRRTTADDNAQDLAVAQVDIDQGGSRRWPLALLGAAFAVVGTALVVRRP